MLKGLTNTIKNACNDIELTLSEYIVIDGKTIPIKAELNDDCYDNGNFVGTFILKELKFEASNDISYRNKEFEYYKRINGESIKIGTFITTEINNSDSEEVTKVVAMDYGLKTQVEYKSNLDYSSGNITLLDVWNECCELSGLESGVTKFTNSDFIVTDDQFTGTGATIRDVFIGIGLSSGSFIKVMNDDKIYPIFSEYDSNIKSGNIITLENDINNNPIDITIDGKSKQKTTKGNQLLDFSKYDSSSSATMTLTFENDVLTTTCIASGTYRNFTWIITDLIKANPGKTLSFAFDKYDKSQATNSSVNLQIYTGSNVSYFGLVRNDGTSAPYTIPEDVSNISTVNFRILPNNSATPKASTLVITKPMLQFGTDKLDYEEYTGGQPSPSSNCPQEIKSVEGIENLFDKNKYINLTSNGITATITKDYINVKGTATANAFLTWQLPKIIKSGTVVTMSANNNEVLTSIDTYLRLCYDELGTEDYISRVPLNITNKSKTFTTTHDDDYLQIRVNSGDVLDINLKIKIEEGSIVHDYVPYGHWLEVKNTGKNKLEFVDGTYSNNRITADIKNGKITLNGTATATSFITINNAFNYTFKANQKYTISFNNKTLIRGTDARFRFSKNNGIVVKDFYFNNINSSQTFYFTEDTEVKWIQIRTGVNITYDNFIIFPQLEKGSTATEYEPYKETSTLIDMNKYDSDGNITGYYELSSIGDTKDELNIDKDGNVSITQNIGEVVLNGSETINLLETKNNVCRYVVEGVIYSIGKTECKSNKFMWYENQATNTSFNSIDEQAIHIRDNNRSIGIKINKSIASSVDEFKTWLSTHPVTVKYILAEPQTISLGKMTPLKLLEGTNNITTTDELQPNMEIEYSVINEIVEEYTELEDKRDTQPITCLRLGLSQIEGENVDIQDEDLIKKYGEHWLIINDNPFAYTQAKRVELINAIFDKVKGFGYSAFVSKASFKPYLTCGDVIKFKNKAGELVKSIVLRYNHNFDEITLEAPSETSATVKYVYPTKDIDLIKRTEIIVDKNTNQITSLTQQTTSIQDNLQQNYYDKTQTNRLIQTSGEGITNTFSEAGGNNIFRNTGLWFEDSSTSYYIYPKSDLYPSNQTFTNGQRAYEFWDGLVLKEYYDKAANLTSLLLQKGYFEQKQQVPNGNYTVSFKYKKLIESATTKVIINNVEYDLTNLEDTEFRTGEQDSNGNYITQPLEVTDGYIFVRFYTNVNNSTIIYDLMVNAGSVKLAYSQNQNETTTDTVNISKGITITSSNTDTTFKANSDGIRTLNKNNETLSEFTDKGMKNKQIEVTDEATIVQVLWQNVGDQTWLTRL